MRWLVKRAAMVALTVLAMGSGLATIAPAQRVDRAAADRAELSRRLLLAEEAWARFPTRHAPAVPALNRALTAYFTGNTKEAAHAIDDASTALWGDEPHAPSAWSRTLAITLSQSLLDRAAFDAGQAKVRITRMYGDDPLPDDAWAEIVVTLDGAPIATPFERLPKLPAEIAIKPASAASRPAGTPRGLQSLRIDVRILSRRPANLPLDPMTPLATCRAAIADDLEPRLLAIEAASEAAKDDDLRTTLSLRAEVLRRLAIGAPYEAPIDVAELLRTTEALAARAAEADPLRGQRGDLLLAGPHGTRRDVARVFVPLDRPADQPLPLVIAVHGTSGSENMFFEAYDRGRIVDLCRERGWMLAAPRGPMGMGSRHIDQALRLAQRVHPVDEKRIFLVGHSLGAGQVIAAAGAAPERWAAVAPVSGGGFGMLGGPLKTMPMFSARGGDDPLGGGGRRSRAESQPSPTSRPGAAAGDPASWHVERVYPDVEHIMIMHECLGDVMRFFDQVAAKR